MLGGIGSTIAQGMLRKKLCSYHMRHCNVNLQILIWYQFFIVYFFAGMAFGTGSAVAHRAVDAVMGPRTIQHEAVVNEAAAAAPAPTANSFGGDACGIHSKAFQDVCSLSSSIPEQPPLFIL